MKSKHIPYSMVYIIFFAVVIFNTRNLHRPWVALKEIERKSIKMI